MAKRPSSAGGPGSATQRRLGYSGQEEIIEIVDPLMNAKTMILARLSTA
jgi:hypothetical protein